MTNTITINHPELTKMFEKFGAPSAGDIPGLVCLCGHRRTARARVWSLPMKTG